MAFRFFPATFIGLFGLFSLSANASANTVTCSLISSDGTKTAGASFDANEIKSDAYLGEGLNVGNLHFTYSFVVDRLEQGGLLLSATFKETKELDDVADTKEWNIDFANAKDGDIVAQGPVEYYYQKVLSFVCVYKTGQGRE